MSTVLTNGIIIPDNGSRNWGGDLANNWNIIDVNVGYMTDVKNRVTTLENSTAENTANIQINTSNISALQTSKQDVIEDLETIRAGATAGATAVQPSALNNYVDLSSEQVINGAKTFSSMLTCSSTVALLGTSTDKYLSIQSGGAWDNGARISLYSKEHSQNSGQFEIVAFNDENKANAFQFSTDGVIPISIGGTLNLGTSSNKWKSINGINPGALSLPNCGEYVDVTSQVVNVNGVFQYTNNLYDGWLLVTAIADKVGISNQNFEDRSLKGLDDVVTINIALRLNETASMRFANFAKFIFVRLFKVLGNV